MFSGSVRDTPEDTCKLPRITQTSFLRALCDLHPWLWMLISSDLSIWIHSTSQCSTCSTSPPRDIFGGDIEARLEFGCWISFFLFWLLMKICISPSNLSILEAWWCCCLHLCPTFNIKVADLSGSCAVKQQSGSPSPQHSEGDLHEILTLILNWPKASNSNMTVTLKCNYCAQFHSWTMLKELCMIAVCNNPLSHSSCSVWNELLEKVFSLCESAELCLSSPTTSSPKLSSKLHRGNAHLAFVQLHIQFACTNANSLQLPEGPIRCQN